MRVLQICLKPPLPAIDGGCLAMDAITQGLIKNKIQVKLLTISTPKHPFNQESLPQNYISKTEIENVFVDTKIKPVEAFCNLFSKESYNIKRFYNEEFKALIITTLKNNKYDIVLLESLFIMPYIEVVRSYSNAKIIYRAHNVEHEIWERNAIQTKGLKKKYVKLLAKRLKTYEKQVINKVDGIAAITAKDKLQLEKLGCIKPLSIIPFGIDVSKYEELAGVKENGVFYIGSMDWLPNQEGVKWLLDKVWKKVVLKNSDANIKLAGKNMPHWVMKYNSPNVSVVGEVDNAIDFINDNSILVVPLFAGSGMRIKVIEAMALGKLVIATSIAAEGINYEDKKNIIIANTDIEFINAIDYYLKNKLELKQIGAEGKQLVQSNYDNQVIVNNLVAFFNELK